MQRLLGFDRQLILRRKLKAVTCCSFLLFACVPFQTAYGQSDVVENEEAYSFLDSLNYVLDRDFEGVYLNGFGSGQAFGAEVRYSVSSLALTNIRIAILEARSESDPPSANSIACPKIFDGVKYTFKDWGRQSLRLILTTNGMSARMPTLLCDSGYGLSVYIES
ncbi:hypothetical protein [Vreelandella stevensii]|uniref:hypothetical protein n=1 Tax=Vreelandella stevensii TaxID=502821 RepID=UPI00403B1978